MQGIRTTPDWEREIKSLLKAELRRREITYGELVKRLALVGVVETEPNIRNKLSRGKFTAVFLIQCLSAIGCKSLRLAE